MKLHPPSFPESTSFIAVMIIPSKLAGNGMGGVRKWKQSMWWLLAAHVAASAVLLFVIPDTLSSGFHHTPPHVAHLLLSSPVSLLWHSSLMDVFFHHMVSMYFRTGWNHFWQAARHRLTPESPTLQTSDTWSLVTPAPCSNTVTRMDGHTGQWRSWQPSTCTATAVGTPVGTGEQALL